MSEDKDLMTLEEAVQEPGVYVDRQQAGWYLIVGRDFNDRSAKGNCAGGVNGYLVIDVNDEVNDERPAVAPGYIEANHGWPHNSRCWRKCEHLQIVLALK